MNTRSTLAQTARFWIGWPILKLRGSKLPGGIDDPIQWLRGNAPAGVHDIRAKPGERFGKRAIPRGARTWDQIEGVCFHQTAVGPKPMGVKAIRKCPVHTEIDADAGIWLLWDPRVILWHANYLNDESIGIEIDCRAAGVEGDESTVWLSDKEKAKGVQASDVVREATNLQLKAGEAVAIYFALLLRANWSDHGRRVKVWAHRQGSWSRTTDPGQRIYRGSMEPLLERPDFMPGDVQGDGHAIDQRWPSERAA